MLHDSIHFDDVKNYLKSADGPLEEIAAVIRFWANDPNLGFSHSEYSEYSEYLRSMNKGVPEMIPQTCPGKSLQWIFFDVHS